MANNGRSRDFKSHADGQKVTLGANDVPLNQRGAALPGTGKRMANNGHSAAIDDACRFPQAAWSSALSIADGARGISGEQSNSAAALNPLARVVQA